MVKQILQHTDLHVFAQMALVIFVAVFVAVAIRTFRAPRSEMDTLANLPNDESESPKRV